jgi:acyl dehydratase
MTDVRYFDDLAVGQSFTSPPHLVTSDEIVTFAQQYDPQPFHTDPQAAVASPFGKHVASGWHTAAITMRLLALSDYRPAGGSVGAGVESLQWPQPVVPGDVLRLRIEIADLRRSRSKPDRGVVTLRIRTLNAADELVQDMRVATIVPRDPHVMAGAP